MQAKDDGTPYGTIHEVLADVQEQWHAVLASKKHPVVWFQDELSPDVQLMNFAKNAMAALERAVPKFQDKLLKDIDQEEALNISDGCTGKTHVLLPSFKKAHQWQFQILADTHACTHALKDACTHAHACMRMHCR